MKEAIKLNGKPFTNSAEASIPARVMAYLRGTTTSEVFDTPHIIRELGIQINSFHVAVYRSPELDPYRWVPGRGKKMFWGRPEALKKLKGVLNAS